MKRWKIYHLLIVLCLVWAVIYQISFMWVSYPSTIETKHHKIFIKKEVGHTIWAKTPQAKMCLSCGQRIGAGIRMHRILANTWRLRMNLKEMLEAMSKEIDASNNLF